MDLTWIRTTVSQMQCRDVYGAKPRLRRRRCYPTPSGLFFLIIANRQVHWRFRGATAVNCTLSGTQRNGRETATPRSS